MASKRRRRRQAGLIEIPVLGGGAVGLWLASRSEAHTAACPKSGASCLDHTLGVGLGHLAFGAIAGATVGLLLVALALALRRALRRQKLDIHRPGSGGLVSRRGRPPTGPSASAVGLGTVDEVAVSRRSPELTKPELTALRLRVRKSVIEAMREMGGGGNRHEILGRAISSGGFTRRELEAPPAKRSRHKYSRLIDHDLSWALTDLKRDGLATNPVRGVWMLTEKATKEPEISLAEAVPPSRLAELRAMPYDEYLRTPEWRRTRAAALVQADHRCALDPTHADRLEVHHRYYERRGAELPSDLIVLCQRCHRRHHLETRRTEA